MAQNYYFFRTVKVGGRQRLRPLPGQKEPSGRHIDESLNVQADSRMREDYPLGTIFGSESLELRSLHSTTFYSAGAIYPIGLNLGDYHSQSHMPSSGMNEAYEDYKADIEDKARPVLSGESTLFTENGNAANPGTLLAQIKADRKMNAPTIEDEGFHIADKDWYLLVRNIKSKFTQDIQKPGVILLDELSRAPVTTNNILFPCLDSRRMLPVEMAGGDELRSIPVHPDCVFVATANVGAEYTGTMSLDRALVGRFFPLELDYMPLECEVQVLTKRCGILPADAENIASVAGTVRSLYGKQEISCTISTRETLAAARLVADGWSSLEAMELTFLPLFEGTRTEGERGMVAKIFMTR